jgi:hypothetical protein
MSESSSQRVATLANGEQVPLEEAAHYYGLIRGLLQEPYGEWDVVYYLRQACLGEDLEEEHLRVLRSHQMLTSLDDVEPVLRAVVLASVRGEGRTLYLDSPFVTPHDRLVAGLLDAVNDLEREEFDRIVNNSAVRQMEKDCQELKLTMEDNNPITVEDTRNLMKKMQEAREQNPDTELTDAEFQELVKKIVEERKRNSDGYNPTGPQR